MGLMNRKSVRWPNIIKKVLWYFFSLGLFLYFYGFKFEPNRLVVVRVHQKELAPLKFGLIADMQYRARDFGLMQKTVAALNKEDLDFVMVAGDWIEEAKDLRPLMNHMKDIKAPIYGVLGNHDYWAYGRRPPNNRPIAEALAKIGGKMLINDSISLKGNWALVGLDDGWEGRPDPALAFQGTKGKKRLLLFHEPEIVNFVPQKFELAFAGHSHGGQVRLPGIGALHVPGSVGKFDRGLFQVSKTKRLYVTSGIGRMGTKTPRFLCPPEIVIFDSN